MAVGKSKKAVQKKTSGSKILPPHIIVPSQESRNRSPKQTKPARASDKSLFPILERLKRVASQRKAREELLTSSSSDSGSSSTESDGSGSSSTESSKSTEVQVVLVKMSLQIKKLERLFPSLKLLGYDSNDAETTQTDEWDIWLII